VIGRNAHTDEEPDYLSYLLRLWCVKGDKGRVWRASLLSIQSRHQVGFAGLEALFEYLRARTSAEAAPGFGNRASTRPRLPKSVGRKGGDDRNSVDPEPTDL
jgi:hypothetical protein